MKKLFSLILFFLIIFFFGQILITVFTKSHKVDYIIKTANNKYKIFEFFTAKNSSYDFIITDKNKNTYTLSLIKDYNKQKNIIKDILYFEKDNISCLYPLFKRNYSQELLCYYKNEQVSVSYLNQKKPKSIQKIIKSLEKKGYKTNILEKEQSASKFETLNIYKANLLENYYFTIWNYKGFYLLNKNNIKNIKLLSKDKYENKLSILLNNYYIYFDTNKKVYNQIFIYDLLKEKKEIFKIKDYNLSKNIYFNGIYNDLLYFTDIDYKKQYSFDPKKKKLLEISDQNYLKIVNNKKQYLSKADFFQEKVYFLNSTNKKITKKYQTSDLRESNNYYYFLSDNKIYKSLKREPKKGIVLFELPNIKDWKVKNNNLLIISNDIVYFYSDSNGLLPIVKNNELNYNYKNICDFWKKE